MANPKLTDSQFFRIQDYRRSQHHEYNNEIFKLKNSQNAKSSGQVSFWDKIFLFLFGQK